MQAFLSLILVIVYAVPQSTNVSLSLTVILVIVYTVPHAQFVLCNRETSYTQSTRTLLSGGVGLENDWYLMVISPTRFLCTLVPKVGNSFED